MERVDDFFEKRLSGKEKEQFESDLKSDPELRQSVALFLASKQAAADEAQSQLLSTRHREWVLSQRAFSPRPALQVWVAAAAVLILAIGLVWYQFFNQNYDLKHLSAAYSEENFTTLNMTMGGSEDSLKRATEFFNKGAYQKAGSICESILKNDPKNAQAKKIAGIVSLKLLDYDKAITYFHELGQQEYLQDNPGKFYEAIALIQRDLPLDKKKAESLLQEVITGNLEGKEQAEKWLK